MEQSLCKFSSAWLVPPVPFSRAPLIRSPHAFRTRRAAREELVWAKKQKHEKKKPHTHGGARRRRRRRRKKRSRNGATRPACFRGIPRCCWQTPFFGAVRLPRAPARSWFSLTYPASLPPRLFARTLSLSLSLLFSDILARSAPSCGRLLFYFLTLPRSFKLTPYPRAIY